MGLTVVDIYDVYKKNEKLMQGSFRESQQTQMATDFRSSLVHPAQIRKETNSVAVAAGAGAAGAAGGAAGPAAAVAPAPVTSTVIVHAPLQRFSVDDYLVFVEPGTDIPLSALTESQWIVPYKIESAFTDIAAGTGNPIDNKHLGRADSIREALDSSVKDPALGYFDLQSFENPPNLDYAKNFQHFLLKDDEKHRKIGERYLLERLERAERLDYEFALRMQGLQNCNINAVWSCADPSVEAVDRFEMMEQFLRGYLSRFLAKNPQVADKDQTPDHIIQEAVQMHHEFCSSWVREHKRGLSPAIEAAAEALVGVFFDGALRPAVKSGMTRKEVSRMIRRDPHLAPHFGLCLHFYMVKLEQDRGMRNASYKSMVNANSSNMLSINSMDSFMRANMRKLQILSNDLENSEERLFNVKTIDWYGIVLQMGQPKLKYTGLKRSKVANVGDHAPWAFR